MKASIFSIGLLLIFLIMIIAPLVMFPKTPNADWRAVHLPAQGDSISTRVLKMFGLPAAYADYFRDHHYFHGRFVEAYRFLKLYAAHDRVFPNVLIGEMDWLYYTGENNIRDYECTFMFNAEELMRMEQNLTGWQQQLSAAGIDFYVVIAPNKETVYPQFLPKQIDAGLGVCRIDQTAAMLAETDLKVLDLRTALQMAAQEEQIFHRTDTHWNDSGALIAATEILGMINQDYPGVSIPTSEEYTEDVQLFSGDLAGFLPTDDRFVEQAVMLKPISGARAVFEQGEGRTISARIEGSDLPRVVIFKDSFSDALAPFLAEHFSETHFIQSSLVDTKLAEEIQADIVILEVAQRYLVNLR